MGDQERIAITPTDVGPLLMEELTRRVVFCAREQKRTPHYIRITPAEVIFTCACGGTLKFRSDLTDDQIRLLLDTHERDNLGQVPAKALKTAARKRMEALADPD